MITPSETCDKPEKEPIFTVHQLNQTARALLENHFQLVWIKGELSNVALPRSGHIYFTLKDKHAQVRCAMFKGSNRRLNFTPTDGMEVLIRASVSVYEERGDYQLIVAHMEKWGVGQLQQAFEALKLKLQNEGLFDLRYKKPLPRFPRHIGVITSPTGAAIRDILSVLKRRYPFAPVTVYPTEVQGKGAGKSIAAAIELANRHQAAEVLILARGGGSLEDLWGFNEESVAYAIFGSQIPIVSGVGHEVDFTIADFVADCRAPTPSVAAETVTPDTLELLQLFEHKKQTLIRVIQRILQQFALKMDVLEKQLIHPGRHLTQALMQCHHLQQRLTLATQNLLERLEQKLAKASMKLHVVSPLATLGRGYAIVSDDKEKIIRSSKQVAIGQEVTTKVGEGSFISTVKEINF